MCVLDEDCSLLMLKAYGSVALSLLIEKNIAGRYLKCQSFSTAFYLRGVTNMAMDTESSGLLLPTQGMV